MTKRDLLLFDTISVMGLELELSRLYDCDERAAADLDYLASTGIVGSAPRTGGELADSIRVQLSDELAPLLQGVPEWPTGDGSRSDQLLEAELIASSVRHPVSSPFRDIPLARGGELLVAFLGRLTGSEAVAVLDRSPTRSDWRRLRRGVVVPKSLRGMDPDARVVEIVLRALPVPSENTSIEAIVDFVADPDVRAMSHSLRLWIRKMAREVPDARDVELELETMLHNYRQHLRIHRLRSQDNALRSVLSVPLAVAEELVHLRPKGAIDALFGVRERRATRLEAQLASPGHELAFIDAAHREFG